MKNMYEAAAAWFEEHEWGEMTDDDWVAGYWGVLSTRSSRRKAIRKLTDRIVDAAISVGERRLWCLSHDVPVRQVRTANDELRCWFWWTHESDAGNCLLGEKVVVG